MRKLFIGLTVAALSLAVAACSSAGGSGGTGGKLDGTAWILKTYAVKGTATPVPSGLVVDARFGTGKVSGFGGCNVYTGPATISGTSLKIGPIASTKMACEQAANDLEMAYLANLALAATFTAAADNLTVFGSDGKQLLAYSAAPANPLLGEWNVTGYNNGAQAVTSPIAGTELTVTFTADDQAGGNAGCNNFTGGYKLDGTSLTVGPLATTMKACDQPISDQETQFLGALQTPTTVETSGANVTLRDASGAIQVTLAPK